MKKNNRAVKLIVSIFLVVALIGAFSLTSFADSEEYNINISYRYWNIITRHSFVIFDSEHNAIGSAMFYFTQTTPYSCTIDYEMYFLESSSSCLLSCNIKRGDTITPGSGNVTYTSLESETTNQGALNNCVDSITFTNLTKYITIEMRFSYYNTSTSLMEMYTENINLSFGYLPLFNTEVYTIFSATYTET